MAKDSKKTAKKAAPSKATAKKTTAAKSAAVKETAVTKKAASTKKPVVKKTIAKKKAAPAKKAAVAAKMPKQEKVKSTKETPKAAPEATAEATAAPKQDGIEQTFPGLDKNRDWQSFAIRVLYIIAFGFLGWLAFLAAIVMTVIQVVITILLGSPNKTLQSWVCSIGQYLAEVFEYVSWRTDERPFPLGRPAPIEDTVKS